MLIWVDKLKSALQLCPLYKKLGWTATQVMLIGLTEWNLTLWTWKHSNLLWFSGYGHSQGAYDC